MAIKMWIKLFLFVARNIIAQFIVCDLGTETSICVFNFCSLFIVIVFIVHSLTYSLS